MRSKYDRDWADSYYRRWPENSADTLSGADEIRKSPAWRLPEWYENHQDIAQQQKLLFPKTPYTCSFSFHEKLQQSFSLSVIQQSMSERPYRFGVGIRVFPANFYDPSARYALDVMVYSKKECTGSFLFGRCIADPDNFSNSSAIEGGVGLRNVSGFQETYIKLGSAFDIHTKSVSPIIEVGTGLNF